MIRLFKQASESIAIILLVLVFLLNINLFFGTHEPIAAGEAPLGQLWEWFVQWTYSIPYLPAILYCIMVFVQALLLNTLFNSTKWLIQNTFLPAYCFILLAAFFNTYLFLSPIMIALIFVIIALQRMYATRSNTSFVPIFDVGFYISIASLLYLPSLALLPFAFIAFVLTRQFNLREWTGVILGAFLPYIFLFTYFFMTDNLAGFANHFSYGKLIFSSFPISIYEWTKLLIVFLAAAIGLYHTQKNYLKNEVKTRQLMTMTSVLFFCSLLLFAVNPVIILSFSPMFNILAIMILLVPLSILFAYALSQIKNNLQLEVLNAFLLLLLFFFHLAAIV